MLDITMPLMNGIEMLDQLKSDADLKDIPVIMLTAESGKANIVGIVGKGAKDYMVKPFKAEDLIKRVGKILSLEPRMEDASPAPKKKPRKYFSGADNIVVLTLPARVTRPVALEVEGRLQSEIKDMKSAMLKKIILDMSSVAETNISLIKLVINAFQQCQEASAAVKLVASAGQAEELKGFQETSQIAVAISIEEAKAAF